jgi:hypothetical protein
MRRLHHPPLLGVLGGLAAVAGGVQPPPRRCRCSTPTCTTATTPWSGAAGAGRGHPAQGGAAGVLVSSSDDEGTQKLLAAAPDLIVPELRPYRTRADTSTWVRDEGIVRYLEQRLARHRYVGMGEFHLYGADAELPVPRRMVALARERGLLLHAHSDVDAVDRLFQQWPDARVLWAHSGFDGPRRCASAAPAPAAVVRPGLSRRPRQRRQGRPRLARGLRRVSRSASWSAPTPSRPSAGTTSAARRLDPPVAGRPAAAAGRAPGLAQCRRAAARRPHGMRALRCGAAAGCWRARGAGRRRAAARRWTPRVRRVIGRGHGCRWPSCRSRRRWPSGGTSRSTSSSARGPARAAGGLRVDADMPAHRHGMNYRATVACWATAATAPTG